MNTERDLLLKRPFELGLDQGLKEWLRMRRQLSDAKDKGGHEHIIRKSKYKYRIYWNCKIFDNLPSYAIENPDDVDKVISEISNDMSLNQIEIHKLNNSLSTHNSLKLSPLEFPIAFESDKGISSLQDEMKCVLCQNHERIFLLKLDFYWVNPDLIIDRKSSQTMIHYTCFNGDCNKTSILVERKADVNVQDFKGQTPLLLAINSPRCIHSLKLIRLLLDNGADINLADNRGFTPLHKACAIGDLKIIEVLLIRKAIVNIRDKKNKFAIEYAKVDIFI